MDKARTWRTGLVDKRKKNNNNNNHVIIPTTAAATLFTLATIFVVSSMATPVAATTTTSNTTTITPSSGIELSPQPIYQERSRDVSQTPTHTSITFTGNGTLTLPNTTETINTTSNASALIQFMTNSAQRKETIRTEDGETATATLYEIAQFNPVTGEGKGIVIAVFNTNSTGMLAPLSGMITAGIDDIQPTGQSFALWEWESGIGNARVAPPMQ